MSESADQCAKAQLVKEIALKLHQIGAVKFGEFKLKSGAMSPIYIDLRLLVSYPETLKLVADAMWAKVSHLKFDLLCGVPYTALPIATVMSLAHAIPMVMRRKEAKAYGTGKIIEGVFQPGQAALVVEDLISSGTSIFETVTPLQDSGLDVTHAVVLIDREQGGVSNARSRGLNVISVFSITQLLDILHEEGKVESDLVEKAKSFINSTKLKPVDAAAFKTEEKKQTENESESLKKTLALPYTKRAELAKCALSKEILRRMDEKQTNLCLSIDVLTSSTLLNTVDALGPHLIIVKLHVDILTDFEKSILQKLRDLSAKHKFFLFEDRKYADIGNTTKMQFLCPQHEVGTWAHLVTAHPVPGPGILSGIREGSAQVLAERAAKGEEAVNWPASHGVLLLAQMSSAGALAKGEYTQATVNMAIEQPDIVAGLIAQEALCQAKEPGMLTLTPGVGLAKGGDSLGQQYDTPDSAIRVRGADIIIVGRGITNAEDPVKAALEFKKQGWEAYVARQQ